MNDKQLFTHRGMWAIWDYENYKYIDSVEAFENTFSSENDVVEQIKKNRFVPIFVHLNGEFLFRVKYNEKLDKRENKYVSSVSKTYLFETEGKAYLSGIELIDNVVLENEVLELNLEKGLYEIVINLIEWDKEPGMRLDDGSSASDALPDFIILINRVTNKRKKYCVSMDTFG